VNKETLTLKHSYNITKEEVSKEYILVVNEIESISDNLYDIFADCDNNSHLGYEPSRVTFYISPTLCKIRFSIPEDNIVLSPQIGQSEYSASDADEVSLLNEGGELYLSEYYNNENIEPVIEV
jgi:hypothetical protein